MSEQGHTNTQLKLAPPTPITNPNNLYTPFHLHLHRTYLQPPPPPLTPPHNRFFPSSPPTIF